MNRVSFTNDALEDYFYWQTQDTKTLKRVNALINDIRRSGYSGIGKPEPLSGDLSGYWSRRIDDKNRLVYRVVGDNIELYSLRNHYR
jgi:toxin YoeB